MARTGAWPGRAAPMLPDTSKRNLLIFVVAVAIVLGGSQLLGYARLSSQEQTDAQAKATGVHQLHQLVQGFGLMQGAPARSSSPCKSVLEPQQRRQWSPAQRLLCCGSSTVSGHLLKLACLGTALLPRSTLKREGCA